MTQELGPGAQAPAVRLPRLGGGELALPTPGRLTLLIFTKASCPTCRWAAPHFRRVHELCGERGLDVVAVAQDDEPAEQAFAVEHGLTYPIAVESSPWSYAGSFGLTTVPTFVLVDEAGQCAVVSPGFSRDDLLEVVSRVASASGVAPAAGEDLPPLFPDGEAVPAFRPG